MAELLPEIYNPRVLMEKVVMSPESIVSAPQPWLCAWCYKCYRRCPQALKVPEVLLSVKSFLAEQGKLEGFYKALEIIKGISSSACMPSRMFSSRENHQRRRSYSGSH